MKTQKTETRAEKVIEKHHMQRWEVYSLIVIAVLVACGGAFGAYYYINNIKNPAVVTSTTTNVARTAEEKELDQLNADLTKDDALNLSSVDADIKELGAIDLGGL